MTMYDKRSRLDKAFGLIEDNAISESAKPNMYTVKGSKGTSYSVDLALKTCDCDDFVFRCSGTDNKCKHMHAVRLFLEHKARLMVK